MRFHTWIMLCVVCIALPSHTGCTQSDTGDSVAQTDATAVDASDRAQTSPAATESENAETVTSQDVVRNAEETVEAAGALAEQTKDEYIRELNDQLADLDEEMEALDNRATTLTDEAAAEWEETRTDLQEHRRQVQERLDELQSASGEAWRDLREGTDAAWDELQQAFDDASEHFDSQGGDSQPADNERQSQ